MEICTVGSVRGESVGAAMVDLNGHETGNGGYSQGRPTARRVLLYSERWTVTALDRERRVAFKGRKRTTARAAGSNRFLVVVLDTDKS